MSSVQEVTLAPEYEQQHVHHSNVDYATKVALRFFLEPTHYQKLHTILSEAWQGSHSLAAAIHLIKAHGRDISPEEEARLADLGNRSDEAMIEALVDFMPRDKPDQFEHFFLQLSFIASTTTRLRTALEAGHPDLVEEALESAENVGVLPYLLKMAVSQAGQEVHTLEAEHDSWLHTTTDKLGPLLSTAIAAMEVQKDLTQAKSTIEHFQLESREKSRSVLQGMMGSKDAHILANAFGAYADYVRRTKREEEISKEYEDELHAIQEKLMNFKESQLSHIRNVVNSQVSASLDELVARCFHAFAAELEANKAMFRMTAEEKALKRRIDSFATASSQHAKAMMGRVAEHSTQGSMALAFEALKFNVSESKHEREIESQTQQTKAKMAERKAKQKSFGKSMLTAVIAEGDAALVQVSFSAWRDCTIEDKEEGERTQKLAAKTSMIKNFTEKNKTSAMSAADAVAHLEDHQLLSYTLLTWKRESKCDRLRRLGKDKNDKRKKELVGVKGLFKSFATELETNLTRGTPRVDSPPKQVRSGPTAN